MSQARDNSRSTPPTNDEAVEAVVLRVLRATGRIVPQTEEEVAQAEAQLEGVEVTLPERLRTPPTSPADRLEEPSPGATEIPATPASESLARAARNGSSIPPEVVERMGRDRRREEERND